MIFLKDIDAHVKEFPLRPSLVKIKEKFKTKGLVAMEIGVDVGNNALCMLQHMNIEKLILVDSYSRAALYYPSCVPYVVCASRLKDYIEKDAVDFVVKPSEEAHSLFKDEAFDFIYVDGDHSFKGCLRDMELYWPKVKKGGCLAGHDYNMDEVKQAVSVFDEKYKTTHTFDGMDFLIHKDSTNPDGSGQTKE